VSDEQLNIDGFQLVNCIATGNDTQVWEVLDSGGSQRFAMKLLLPEAFAEREKISVLKREAKAGKALDHPNLIKIFDVAVTKKYGYLIMEYFRSTNLKSMIFSDLLGVHVRMKRLLEQVCMGLAYMHDKKWLHRDVKPDNILFNRGSELKIIDFSLATRGLKHRSKEIQGTKSYIAPETLLRKPSTPQTDMYSLGVTIFFALTGEMPITGTSPTELLKNHLRVTPPFPSQINPNVTPEMDDFVMRLLAKKPDKRFATMNEAYSLVRSIPIFKEDVEELDKKRAAEDERILKDGVDAARRLDSRSDAQRSELLGDAATKTRPQPKPQPARQQPSPAAQQPAQPPQQPPAAQPYPQPPPAAGYPQPQPPMPGGYPPGMMPPQPMPPQYYPQPPMPQPAPPAAGPPPQQPPPPQPAHPPPQQPPARQPSDQPRPVPEPAKQQQPEPAQSGTDQSDDNELPFMDELPPVK